MAPDDHPEMGETPSSDAEQQSAPEQPRLLPRADAYPFRIIDAVPTAPAPVVPPTAPPPMAVSGAMPSRPNQPKRRGVFILALFGSLVLLGLLLLLFLRALAPTTSTTALGMLTPTAQGMTPVSSSTTGTATPGAARTPTPAAQRTPGTQATATLGPQPTGTVVGVGPQPTNTSGPQPTQTPPSQPTATPTSEPTAPPTVPARIYVSPNPASMSCLVGGTAYLSVDNDGGQLLHWTATTDSSNVTITPSGAVAPDASDTATLHVTLLQLGSFHAIFYANGSVPTVSVLVICS